jgi:hypothetical protein
MQSPSPDLSKQEQGGIGESLVVGCATGGAGKAARPVVVQRGFSRRFMCAVNIAHRSIMVNLN